MKLNFQQEVVVLPATVLSQGDADVTQLRVLLWLASDLSLAGKPKQLAKLADCDVKSVNAALRYWSDRGVLVTEDETSVATMATASDRASKETARKPKRELLQRADELPSYTTLEITELLEKRASVRVLLNEAQEIIGKIFNPSDVNILIGMLDYLGMSEESILMVLAYCKRIGKTNLRAVEKYAYTLVDKGITEPAALEEEFRLQDAIHSFEGEVRSMFGMNSRALTTKENRQLRQWATFGYDSEIVRLAYELTIQATQKPSVDYANGILERWHAEGLKTKDEIDAYLEARKNQRNETRPLGEPTLGNSFDTDDFFEAALQRSFRETGAES